MMQEKMVMVSKNYGEPVMMVKSEVKSAMLADVRNNCGLMRYWMGEPLEGYFYYDCGRNVYAVDEDMFEKEDNDNE